jgi:hypothetical protein
MTRQELATRLAQSEGQLAELNEHQNVQLQRSQKMLEELRLRREQQATLEAEHEAEKQRREELNAQLLQRTRELDQEHGERASRAAEIAALRERLVRNEAALERSRARELELETRIGALQVLLGGVRK